MIEIKKYTKDKQQEWDNFVLKAKNGTFLFLRGYMDYHSDCFQDYSLMFYLKGKLCALLPANRHADVIYSHQGLTYGGLVIEFKTTAQHVCDLFESLSFYLKTIGIKEVVYKAMPNIYAQIPSDEPLYALTHLFNAEIVSRDISSVILLNKKIRFTELRRRGKRKAIQHGVIVKESNDLPQFWEILCLNLRSKYGSKPVHSLEEIELLHQRFPNNIRLWAVSENDTMIGGTLLYLTHCVVKTQYISASPRGKEICALDMLFDFLINETTYQQSFLDLGTSALKHNNDLRLPLLFQKEGFGGRAVCCDTYKFQL